MKRYFLLISLFFLAFASCKKDKKSTVDPVAQAATDDAAIKSYLTTNSINATKDPSGVYYTVVVQGNGKFPTATSSVAVSYTGKLITDGTVFASPQGSTYLNLANTTEGFRIGLQHIDVGGTIRFYVPSGLAFGVNGSGAVPANTCVWYEVNLQGFN